jgi:hypothetical protein
MCGEGSSDADSNDEAQTNSTSGFKMLSDEELFKVCGGRTLHK